MSCENGSCSFDGELKESIPDIEDMLETTKYPIMEVFDSIQGEGSMIGMPVTFVRFAGCNLVCPWCDTKESWDASNNTMMSVKEIADKCNRKIVVFTGGEPCLQKELDVLIDELHKKDILCCMETNGTLPTPANIDWVVASPKPPQYLIHGECFFNELKYVVDDEFNVGCIPDDQKTHCGSIWLQPCDYGKGTAFQKVSNEESVKKCIELTMAYDYLRTGIQLHKLLNIK